ncbi:endonuclease/exonuclease/phosphatase family protein [Spirilliplanes yamanashiensis]|uniref:Endonuclease/exonuclease/phosphatase domain-containing protein n=1 Tax=Spirilliplanes yamanashiensis TaxID=42233 RepID=A0A8J3YAZ6_9ACTN|nr:endonuclease/exonuclease/phosphatase family protein [Spirilliplanes yamanashiensis]MDP9818916.1 endonuclease/exonuclease/phosphatase family metal-dependent hydrolase [Spirilliplanes yamanashiensis]GIJ05371.1 hypothetical protein Sya03_47230 [Spirilliplanes yamanashiensis]
MRVLTWNLWWRFGGSWRERQPRIAAVLAELRPDVAGLVETWSGPDGTQPAALAAPLGLHHAWAPTALPPAPDPPEEPGQAGYAVGLGLLSRWPIAATEVVELPHDQRPGPPPTALLATLDHPAGPLRVIVACIEWEPRYAADQLAQAHALAALATAGRLAGDLPVLLIGDLNADPSQPGLAPLTAVLTDAWAAGSGDPAAVTLASTHPDAPLEAVAQIDRRIDHVLVRPGRVPVTVERAFLAGAEPIDGLHPSDHRAVVVDLRVPGG